MPHAPPPDDATQATVDGSAAPAGGLQGGLKVGDRIGRYLLVETIGRGGMGIVYRAYDPDLDRKVAIKLVGKSAGDTIGRQRVAREAQALARLSHPNVVGIYDVGFTDEQIFIAMELLEGKNLADWLRDQPRSWREIVAAYVQAGRGLAAAHAAGMVHRDVKPSNLHVDGSGRVRILDFGLARAQSDAPAPAVAPEFVHATPIDSLASGASLTVPGAAAGTFRYMSPEQHGGATSPASDQYGFCVSLFESLTGKLPGETAGRPGPRALYALVARGLRAKPEERHASMDVLVAGLERLLARRRRIALAAGALGVAAVATIALTSSPTRSAPVVSCADAAAGLAGDWDEARARALAVRLDAVAPAYDPTAGSRLTGRLDRWAAAWAAARVDACEATFVRHVQSEALLDRRAACLDRRRHAFRAYLDVLGEMKPDEALERGASAAPDPSELAACADTASLLARPAASPAATRLEDELDRAEATAVTGDYAGAAAIADRVVGQARAARLPLLVGEALYNRARYEQRGGHGKEAEATLAETLEVATGADDPRLASRVLAFEVYLIGDLLGRREEGIGLASAARAMARLAGDPPQVLAAIHSNLGNLYYYLGRWDVAGTEYRAALELERRVLGEDHPDVAWSWNNVAMVAQSRGEYGEAREHYQRALDITEKALGGEHPELAPFYNNLASLEMDVPDLPAARRAAERALALALRFGPDHYRVAEVYQSLGDLALLEGQPAEATRACSEARRIRVHDEDRLGQAYADHCLARAALALDPRAPVVELLEATLAAFDDPDEAALVKATLARALWNRGQKARARELGAEARVALADKPFYRRAARELASWLPK